jgi:hypothetical protein
VHFFPFMLGVLLLLSAAKPTFCHVGEKLDISWVFVMPLIFSIIYIYIYIYIYILDIRLD